jgi:hypothetical protein
MIVIRAAFLAIFFGLPSWPSALFTQSDESPVKPCIFATVRIDSSIAGAIGFSRQAFAQAAQRELVDSSIAGAIGFSLPRSSTFTRFSPWKARPKIVLAEAYDNFREETDLGPAVLPSGLGMPSSIAVTTPRVPTPSPLRC